MKNQNQQDRIGKVSGEKHYTPDSKLKPKRKWRAPQISEEDFSKTYTAQVPPSLPGDPSQAS